MNSKKTPELTQEERIDVLERRVKTLENQVHSCLRFMKYHAEKEADRLEALVPCSRSLRVKAQA